MARCFELAADLLRDVTEAERRAAAKALAPLLRDDAEAALPRCDQDFQFEGTD